MTDPNIVQDRARRHEPRTSAAKSAARKKHTNRVRKVLADGTVKYYEYARGGNRPAPVAERDTFAGLIARFESSSEFRELKPSTRAHYSRRLVVLAKQWGDAPVYALVQDGLVEHALEWRDRIAVKTPCEADCLMSLLSAVLGWAAGRRIIKQNVLTGFRRVYKVDRSKIVWTEELMRRFAAHASPELQRVMLLAITTAQRQGDLLKLKWAQYDGKYLALKQEKGGVDVVVPCTKLLRDTLDRLERRSEFILTSPTGMPWSVSNFRSSWRRACARAGIKDLHFHDLRGTAITHLADAGCSIPQICAISGHSLSSAQILTKYVSRTAIQADAAIEKLEAHRPQITWAEPS